MARRNGIWYEGRLVAKPNAQGKQHTKLSRAKTGKLVLDLLIAEQFQERNDKAPQEFRDATKAADAWVNTYTAWHKVRIFGTEEQLRPLVTDPKFNHGAVVVVDASYQEQKPWTDNGGRIHAGRQEQIFLGADDPGTVEIKVLDSGKVLGARDEWERPLWDGKSELPALGGDGSGPAAPQYADDEGF